MTERTISAKDVEPGDLVLYELVKQTPFIWKKGEGIVDFFKDNFKILIDRLICWAEDSMVTHAALITDDLKVVEATIPTLQTRVFKAETDFYIHVRRVQAGTDGSAVLDYLPQSVEEVEADPESYAMMQACLAGIACLFKKNVPDPAHPVLIKILKCVFYEVCKWLDTTKMPFSHGTENWFCSQLAAYAYLKTAITLGDESYHLDIPNSGEDIADSIISHLIGHYAPENGPAIDLTVKPACYDSLFELAEGLFSNAPASQSLEVQNDAEDAAFFIEVFKKLFKAFGIDAENVIDGILKFKCAFVMPSDLIDCLPRRYRIENVPEAPDALTE